MSRKLSHKFCIILISVLCVISLAACSILNSGPADSETNESAQKEQKGGDSEKQSDSSWSLKYPVDDWGDEDKTQQPCLSKVVSDEDYYVEMTVDRDSVGFSISQFITAFNGQSGYAPEILVGYYKDDKYPITIVDEAGKEYTMTGYIGEYQNQVCIYQSKTESDYRTMIDLMEKNNVLKVKIEKIEVGMKVIYPFKADCSGFSYDLVV